jgi:hypothetical protein
MWDNGVIAKLQQVNYKKILQIAYFVHNLISMHMRTYCSCLFLSVPSFPAAMSGWWSVLMVEEVGI